MGWTRAHIGTVGNERADSLAKLAIESENSDITAIIPYPISLVKRIGRDTMIKEWQQDWSSSENRNGRDTYRVIKKVREDFLCSNQVIQYYLTSHGSFPCYLKKIGKKANDLCECGRIGDVTHYLFGRCPHMPYFFYFDNSQTVSKNITRVLFNGDNYRKLCDNYNKLNEMYSFIKYKF